jgi:hypothetical protein
MREMHGGELYKSEFFDRQRGRGVRAEQIAATFKLFKKRAGLGESAEPQSSPDGTLADASRGGGWSRLSSAEFLRRRSLGLGQLGLFS